MKEEYKSESEEAAWAGLHTDTREPSAQAGHMEHEVIKEPGQHEQGACGVSAGTVLHTDTQEAGAQAGHMEHEVVEEPETVVGTQAGPIEHEVMEEPGQHEQGACGVSVGTLLHTDTPEAGAQPGYMEHEVMEEPESIAGTQAGLIEHEVMEEPRQHEPLRTLPVCGVSAGTMLHTDTQEAGAQAGHMEHEVMEEPESVAGTQAGPIEHEVMEEPESVAGTQAGPIEHEVMEEPGQHEQGVHGVSAGTVLHTDTQEPGAQAGRIEHEVKVELGEHEQGACGVSAWVRLHTVAQEPGALAGHMEHMVKVEPMEYEEGVCGVSAWAGLHTDTQEPGALAGHILHEVKVEPVEHEQGACGVSVWAGLHTDTQEAGAQAGHLEHEVKAEPGAHEQSAAAVLAALYQDHKMKQMELVEGPEELHWPKVVLVHPASLSTSERSAVAGRACSVMLEHMRVDLQRRVCSVGRTTYKLRSWLNGQRDSNTREKTNMSMRKISRQRENRRKDRKIKSLIDKDNIKHHEKVQGEKPYKCEDCSYSSARKSHLKRHEMTHTVEKPYKCHYCCYSTISKRHFEAHENTHTGEQPYKCGQFSYTKARKGQVSALPFIQYSPHHMVFSSKSNATSAGFISEEEEVDVVSLGTSELPLATTHVRADSLPRAPSAQERQHTQRTVASATSPRPAACMCMVPRRRGSRSNTDRSVHNAMERLRRTSLRNLFDKLQKQIPGMSRNRREPKIVVLREATFLCRRLRQEDIERECLRKQHNRLLTKLKKLRTIVASLWF